MWQHPFVLLLQLSHARDHSKDLGTRIPFLKPPPMLEIWIEMATSIPPHKSLACVKLINICLKFLVDRWVFASSYMDTFSVLFAVFSLVGPWEASESQSFGKDWIHIRLSSLPASCRPVFHRTSFDRKHSGERALTSPVVSSHFNQFKHLPWLHNHGWSLLTGKFSAW